MAQINKPNEYFNTKLYTGNGSTQSITGVNFQPDWVWLSKEVVDLITGVTILLEVLQNKFTQI